MVDAPQVNQQADVKVGQIWKHRDLDRRIQIVSYSAYWGDCQVRLVRDGGKLGRKSDIHETGLRHRYELDGDA